MRSYGLQKNLNVENRIASVYDELLKGSSAGHLFIDDGPRERYGYGGLKLVYMKKTLDETIATVVVHTVDRLAEFFVKASAAKLVWTNEFIELLQFDSVIRKFWNARGFSDELLESRKFIDGAWDLLQFDFRYDRFGGRLQDDPLEQKFHSCIFEFRHWYIDEFTSLSFPLLDRLRAAELVRPFELDATVQAACGLFSEDFRTLGSSVDGEARVVPENVSQVLGQLLYRYPVFVNPAARMFFVASRDVGIQAEGLSVAFGASYDISADDLFEVIEDYKFQFLRARRYFSPVMEPSHLESDRVITDHLTKAFVNRPTRKNRYVSQENSIAVTLCAMRVWQLIHEQRKDRSEAIAEVAGVFGDTDQEARRKKVRDRYRTIEQMIDKIALGYRAEYPE